MKLKKVAALILAGVMVTGCSSQSGTVSTTAPAEKQETTAAAGTEATEKAEETEPAEDISGTYIIATQGVSGATYSRLAAFAEAAAKYLPDSVTLEQAPISPGGYASIVLIQNDEAQIASGNNVPAKRLYEGEYGDFQHCPDIRALVGGTSNTYLTLMFTDSFQQKTGYTTFEEVVENQYPVRIVTKAQGSFGEGVAEDYLSCFGVTYDDIKSWGGEVYNIDPTQMADMLKEGQADCSIDVLSIGQAAFTELCLTSTMHVLQPGDEVKKAMNDMGYPDIDMPADSFNGQTEDIHTVGACETVVARSTIPDEVAYAFAKALCENVDEIAAQIPTFGTDFVAERACDPAFCGAPLHPGAEKYYREAGYLK
ncbi:MAG: TAXI family TRAP transporter solute-binding subunit [Clostridiales bacterium]|nr:TAXI family TRAP transporter solute-binding subunit [Clostridiales bacterium]